MVYVNILRIKRLNYELVYWEDHLLSHLILDDVVR